MSGNIDPKTVGGFGFEWRRFDQSCLSPEEARRICDSYFRIFPWESLPPSPVGFDLGCGSGRWALCIAPRVSRLHCIDASPEALSVARRNLRDLKNCVLHLASVDQIPLQDGSMDFGYSLGVLHHVPDTLAGLKACVAKLKPGAPLLLYLYYAFDNRPYWYRWLWLASDWGRRTICRLPDGPRALLCDLIAVLVYLPLARFSRILERLGLNVECIPLSLYRRHSFYSMRTDALDRFGTSLERRFSAAEIKGLMERAGLEGIIFSDQHPYWCAVGFKKG